MQMMPTTTDLRAEPTSGNASADDGDVRSESGWLRHLASSRFRRLSGEFVLICLGQTAVVLGALFGVRLLTGLLTPATYGQLALGLTVTTLVGQTLLGPLSSGATRFFAPAWEAGLLGPYLAAVKKLAGEATGIVVAGALVLCVVLAAIGQSVWIVLVVAAVAFAIVSGYNSVLNGMQNAARQRAVVALHQGLASWGRFLLAAAMVVWLGATSAVPMFGYALASVLILVSQGWFFRRTLRSSKKVSSAPSSEPRAWSVDILTYAWPAAVWGLPTWARLASDRWALEGFASTEEVGRYAVLFQLGYYPITIVTNLVVQLVYPVFFQRAGDASDTSRLQYVHRLNRWLTVGALSLTAIATLAAYALHNAVFGLLAAPEYRNISSLLPGIVLAGGLFASGELAAVSLLSSMKTRTLLVPKIASAVLGVVTNVVGAAFWGTAGVVAATAFTAAVYLIWVITLAEGDYCRQRQQGNHGC